MAIEFPDSTLFFDVETHTIAERYALSAREYFRLGGYCWGESDDIILTSDYDEMIRVIRSADVVVGHNIHGFDLSVLFGVESIEPVHMAREDKVFDTLTHATLVNPAPYNYVNRAGRTLKSNTPATARKWFSLDNQAFQLGVEGKSHKFSDLADPFEFEFVPNISKKTGKVLKTGTMRKREGVCCGAGHIPLDHEDYREYLKQDVRATRHVARELLKLGPLDDYAWRTQLVAACDAQISRNGVVIDQNLVDARIAEQDYTTANVINELHDKYNFPVNGKKAMSSKLGKEAVLKAFADLGVHTNGMDRTENGALSFSGDSIKKACGYVRGNDEWVRPEKGNQAALDLAEALGILAGTRTLPQLTKLCTHPDGKVHPTIMALQRSGRKSTTEPGVTIFDSNHKDYFLSDSELEAWMCFDYSNADSRVVAALSGDREYAKRLLPGVDGHVISAIAAYGEEVFQADPKRYRKNAKPLIHTWGYGGGAKTMSEKNDLPMSVTQKFVASCNRMYPRVVAWQNRVREEARKLGYVLNPWGRKMPTEKGREHTQAPALQGQGGTTELLNDAVTTLPDRNLRQVKFTVHDELCASIPYATLEQDTKIFVDAMTGVIDVPGGQRTDFPVGYGEPGRNWKEAEHA